MRIANGWTDYTLLDCSGGERLEKWGDFTLVRPDPQIIWRGMGNHPGWKSADAVYHRSAKGGGHWENASRLPDQWTIEYQPLDLTFRVRPTGFKHTGLFPEQAVNWEWMSKRIAGKTPKILNLFAYTGGATIAAAKAGASVTHIDASRGMVEQAKENAILSGLGNAPIRYIVEDCRKFVERELRRGNRYDGIIMDPPSYGRGSGGQVWKLEDDISDFIALCASLLSEDSLFFMVNSYTSGLSASVMGYLLHAHLKLHFGGNVECGEIGIPVDASGGVLPCGATAIWER